jgi:trehalose-phosphatase
LIEDKNYTLSLHYRNLPREYAPFFRQEVDRFRRHYSHWPLVWKEGKKVWEVRPGVKWDKGNMALHLSKSFPDALPIVIGDDATDEDMFSALKRRAITVRVGRPGRSSAKFYLRSTVGVRRFLGELCRL